MLNRARLLRAGALMSVAWLLGCRKPVAYRATDLTGTELDPEGMAQRLLDHTGQPRRLTDFQGQVVVLFFGYTQCPDVCPTVLTTMSQVMDLLGADSQKLQVLFVTIDPERDTQALLAQYLPQFHPSFLGLRGDASTTALVAKAFKVNYEKRPGAVQGQYAMDHSTGSYVLDAKGRLRLYFAHDEKSTVIAEDLRQLIADN